MAMIASLFLARQMPLGRWCTHASRKWKRKVDLSNADYSLPIARGTEKQSAKVENESTTEFAAVWSGFGLG